LRFDAAQGVEGFFASGGGGGGLGKTRTEEDWLESEERSLSLSLEQESSEDGLKTELEDEECPLREF
jgi:hypothetical protein